MIYFDNSATTKPYPEVIRSFAKAAEDFFGNPSSLHGIGASAEKLLSQARRQIGGLLGVKEQEIYFTSGGTEGNNLAVKGAALANEARGRHIVTTQFEHASVLAACTQLESKGYEITYLPINEEGKINVEDLKRAMRKDTILVSIMHVNNEVGSVQPIEEIGEYLSGFQDTLFHVDHVQGVGKVPLDINRCKIDLCTISGHKFHGLKGTGVLYVREGTKLTSLFSGGSQEANLRSGTENVAGNVALAKALRMSLDKQVSEGGKLRVIKEYLLAALQNVEGVLLNSTNEGAPHILNFSVPGLKSEVLVHALEERDVFVSTTSACSSKRKSSSKTVLAMFDNEIRAESTIRISLSYQNDLHEAEEAMNAIKAAIHKLQKIKR